MNEVRRQQASESQDEFINGIKGLAAFLGVTAPTAGKIKNDVPFYQHGKRTIRFKKSEVLAALARNHKTDQPCH